MSRKVIKCPRNNAGSRQGNDFVNKRRQISTFVIAPQVNNATSGALRYMARTKQSRTYLPLTFPSRSRYSFTDPERMEGRASQGPGCKEQLAHGCYATARNQRDSNPLTRGRWSSALTTRLSRHPSRWVFSDRDRYSWNGKGALKMQVTLTDLTNPDLRDSRNCCSFDRRRCKRTNVNK